ncbi:MAG: hypothetical protein IKQ11_03265 [Paludibacteraceae bacterium]|nr:hypothetical protein [Paludibacteraceae bacterium]
MIYQEFSEEDKLLKMTDSVFFRFCEPKSGWIKMEIFVNGTRYLISSLSTIYDPFPSMKHWLEDIVKGLSSENVMRIDSEASELIFHYEELNDAKHGIFYIYDSESNTILARAIVKTKELVTALYLAMLDLASNGYNRKCSDFGKEWYCIKNENLAVYNTATFYNAVKSPLIEWYFCSPKSYRQSQPTFKEFPEIKESIQMWCDYGAALFWSGGEIGHQGACGDASEIFTETCGVIDLRGIEELQEWYDRYDKGPLPGENGYDCETKGSWFEQGKEFAKKVRELLPDTIDLYYYDWYPSIEVPQENRLHFPERLPMIVFNSRLLDKFK